MSSVFIHISGYQLDTLELPSCGDQEKKVKTGGQLNLIFTLGWDVVAVCNSYQGAQQHLCIYLFKHSLKSSLFLISDMDFEGTSTVRNTFGWAEMFLFLWLIVVVSSILLIITCVHYSNTTCKKKVYPRHSIEKNVLILTLRVKICYELLDHLYSSLILDL